MWTGLTVLAATLNRKVWLDRRSGGVTWYKIYPGQLMCVLVAPPAKGHKSTAIGIGTKLMEEVGVKTLDAKISTEKLIVELSNNNQPTFTGTTISLQSPDAIATIVAPELAVFLNRQVYSDTIVSFLNRIYDAEPKFKYMTQKGGTITLYNPCVTMLAGSTPISIGESIPEQAHNNGYLSRVLHIYHNGIEKAPDALTDLNDHDLDKDALTRSSFLKDNLIEELRNISKLTGPISYSKSGRDWYNDWYSKWKLSPESESEGYAGRKHDHLLRVAILLRISEFQDLVLDEACLEAALIALNRIEGDTHLALSFIGNTSLARSQERILEAIKKSPLQKIETTALTARVRRYFTDRDQLRLALKTLIESGEIKYDGITNGLEWWSLP